MPSLHGRSSNGTRRVPTTLTHSLLRRIKADAGRGEVGVGVEPAHPLGGAELAERTARLQTRDRLAQGDARLRKLVGRRSAASPSISRRTRHQMRANSSAIESADAFFIHASAAAEAAFQSCANRRD